VLGTIWIEIPVRDIERARGFYEGVFALKGGETRDDGERLTVQLYSGDDNGRPGISLTQHPEFHPCDRGLYVYFDCGTDMNGHMERVTAHGGTLMTGRVSMGQVGSYCTVKDTEGNVFGLYEMPQ
jgi:predicted enzyme related to lactoylglutathione lyase